MPWRSRCGLTSRARGVRSGCTARGRATDFEHGDEIRVGTGPSSSTRGHRPGATARWSRRSQPNTASTATEVHAGHDRLTALGRRSAYVRVRPGAAGKHVRRPPAGPGRPRRRVRGRAGEGAVRRTLHRRPAALGSRRLRDVARSAGLAEHITRGSSAGEAYAREVRADEAAAAELGVTGVPYFQLGGAWPCPAPRTSRRW